jgi:hypothetical protein
MNSPIIDQVVEQLSAMPQPLQQRVLKFVRTLAAFRIRGTPGQQLLRFAGTIPLEDLQLMQMAIEQGCERIDLDEW